METKQVILPNNDDKYFNLISYDNDTPGILVVIKDKKPIGYIYTYEDTFNFSNCSDMSCALYDDTSIKKLSDTLRNVYGPIEFEFIKFSEYNLKRSI